jgi:MFS family permease
MTTSHPGAPNWRRNHAAVTIATFIGFTGFTLVMPFLPLYFQQLGVREPGAVAVWSGLCLGVTPAVTAAMTPLWTRLSARFGHKLMVERSLFSFIVIMALTAFATRPWHVLALRIVQGFFAGYGPIAMVLAVESAPAEHLASAIGWVQTAQRLGPALGPVIGGLLAGALGLRGAFLASAGVYAVALVLVAVGFRESERRHDVEAATPPTLETVRRVPYFVLFVGTIFALQIVDRSFGPILLPYLQGRGVAASSVAFLTGVIFTMAAAAAAVGNHFAGWLLKHIRAAWLVPSACVIAAIAAVVFAVTPPLATLCVAAIILGAGIGVATTAVYAEAGHTADAATRGATFGYLQMAYLIGLAVSPILAGFIGWSVSVRAVFNADALGLVTLAACVWFRLSR